MAESGYAPTSARVQHSLQACHQMPHMFLCEFECQAVSFLLSLFKSSDGDELYRTVQLGGKAGRNIHLEPYVTHDILAYSQESQSVVMEK